MNVNLCNIKDRREVTDTFPKHGRVTEVCKEWRVHEDNALAHHLQSQEINEHYKGNRYRNQTVREDFPTALSEQNKEKENAERQAALYHQMINEQEEADARVARELAEKLKAEMELEQRLQAADNEKMARKLQKELFSDKRVGMPPMPSDSIAPNVYPKKANIQQYSPTVVDDVPVSPSPTSARLNYVSLDLSNPPAKMVQQRSPSSRTQYTQVMPQQSQQSNYDLSSYNEQHHHYDHINLQSHTPEKKQQPLIDQNYRQKTPTKMSGHTSPPLYANAEPIERHPNRTVSPDHYENSHVRSHQHIGHSQSTDAPPARPERTDKQHEMLNAFKRTKNQSESTRAQFERLSLEKYDQIMGNYSGADDHCDGAQGGEDVELNASRQQRSNANVDRIKAMQELGVPPDEIIEIDRRIAQQERDEEFARLLQQQENKNLTFEEQDRLVAMEAQDKELARMLQERERAKAKRAKERARQRKLQQKLEESENASSSHSRTHSELDGDSYSDPIDLIASQDGPAKSTQSSRDVHQTPAQQMYYQDAVNLYDANYSNPVDLIRSTSRSPTSSGSKQSGNHRYDDDMYERPINDAEYNGPKRPNNLDIRHMNRPHQPPRPPKPDELGNIATVIDPTYIESKGSPTTATPNSIAQHSQPTNLPDFLDQSSSSVPPPYMPIQGTRRNISVDNNKKKKGKDKCTHQ